MAGDATVGSIIGYLRLDRSDWDAELTAAGRKADDLARHNPDIRIRTNAPSAIAQLAAVAAATKRLQDAQGAEAVAEARLQSLRDRGVTDAGRLRAAEEAVTKARRAEAASLIALAAAQDANDRAMQRAAEDTDRLAKKADKAKMPTLSLVQALAAISPAAVPIGAVAGGALLGLLPVAATVMLGIKGIENAMKSGAAAGGQFGQSVATLKGDLATLETTAASGLMVGINKAFSGAQPLFKTVNADIAVMSNQLGNIVAGAAPALLRILTDLNPLFVTFGNVLTQGAGKLEHWAQNSSGISHFVTYVQAELPTVEQFLGRVLVLFSHLAQAAAPFGGQLLTGLDAFVGALDRIPVGLLSTAVPLIVGLAAGVKALSLANAGAASLATLSTKLESAGGVAGRASGTVGKLGKAVGYLGPLGLAAGVGLGALALATSGADKQQQQMNQDTADFLNLLQQTNGAITNQVVALATQKLATEHIYTAAQNLGVSATTVTQAVLGNKTAVAQLKTETDKLGPSGELLRAGINNVAKSLADSRVQYQQMTAQQKANAIATKANSAANVVVADTTNQYAAALVKVNTALQTYYDTVLANAATQDQFLLGLKQVGQNIKTNGTSLSENTANGLQNRTMMISLLQAAEAAAKGSSNYTAALEGNVRQFEQSAIHAGFSKKAVEALVAQMHLTPKDIETRFNANTTPAMRALMALQSYIKTHTWDVAVRVNASGQTMGYVPGVGYTQVSTKKPGHNAAGTNNWRGGWTWVGEQGPELVNLPSGSKVMPHRQSMSSAGSPTIGQLIIYPQPGQSEREIGRAAGDEIAWALR